MFAEHRSLARVCTRVTRCGKCYRQDQTTKPVLASNIIQYRGTTHTHNHMNSMRAEVVKKQAITSSQGNAKVRVFCRLDFAGHPLRARNVRCLRKRSLVVKSHMALKKFQLSPPALTGNTLECQHMKGMHTTRVYMGVHSFTSLPQRSR